MARKRDSQRSKVYKHEEKLAEGKKYTELLTLEECEQYVKAAYEAFDLSWYGEVADGRGTRVARGRYQRVSLPRWARNPVVVLHEAAHGIAEKLAGENGIAGHGPEFVRVTHELFEHVGGISPITLGSIANEYKINRSSGDKFRIQDVKTARKLGRALPKPHNIKEEQQTRKKSSKTRKYERGGQTWVREGYWFAAECKDCGQKILSGLLKYCEQKAYFHLERCTNPQVPAGLTAKQAREQWIEAEDEVERALQDLDYTPRSEWTKANNELQKLLAKKSLWFAYKRLLEIHGREALDELRVPQRDAANRELQQ